MDTPESSRTYSSIWYNDHNHRLSKLDSPQAWSAWTVKAGQWIRIDLGAVRTLAGVKLKKRVGGSQYLTDVSIKVSGDGSDGKDVPNGRFKVTYTGDDASLMFDEMIQARYVKIVVNSWTSHPSTRAGVYALQEGEAALLAISEESDGELLALSNENDAEYANLGAAPDPMHTLSELEVAEVWYHNLTSNGESIQCKGTSGPSSGKGSYCKKWSSMCPYGYTLVTGTSSSKSTVQESSASSQAQCASFCNNNNKCKAFQWSGSKRKCRLRSLFSPTRAAEADFIWCARVDDKLAFPGYQECPDRCYQCSHSSGSNRCQDICTPSGTCGENKDNYGDDFMYGGSTDCRGCRSFTEAKCYAHLYHNTGCSHFKGTWTRTGYSLGGWQHFGVGGRSYKLEGSCQ